MTSTAFGPGLDPTGFSAGFNAIFAVALIVIVIGGAFSAVIAVRKYMVLKKAGHDPLTVDAALAAKLLNSDVLRPGTATAPSAPALTVEQRLAELDDLVARGVIGDEERTAARARILGG